MELLNQLLSEYVPDKTHTIILPRRYGKTMLMLTLISHLKHKSILTIHTTTRAMQNFKKRSPNQFDSKTDYDNIHNYDIVIFDDADYIVEDEHKLCALCMELNQRGITVFLTRSSMMSHVLGPFLALTV